MGQFNLDVRQAALEAISEALDSEMLLSGRDWEAYKIASHFSEHHTLIEITVGGVFMNAGGEYDDSLHSEWMCTSPGCRLRAVFHGDNLEVTWKTNTSWDTVTPR